MCNSHGCEASQILSGDWSLCGHGSGGNPHIIVEQVVVLNEVGAGGKIVESQQGASTFYSATSGDVVLRNSDQSFVGKDRNCQFLIHSSE